MDRAVASRQMIYWLASLFCVAAIIRIIVFIASVPATGQDSETYYLLLPHLRSLDFSGYTGHRSPAYSVLILWAWGDNLNSVVVVQLLLGICTSLLLFWICYLHTGSPRLSFLAGLIHSLSLNHLAFETTILTEPLATFCIALSIAMHCKARDSDKPADCAGVAGLSAAIAALTRPLYVYLGPILVVLTVIFEKRIRRLALPVAIAFLVPVVGWMAFNKVTINYFGLQTVAGFGITNHSGRYMEQADDRYAVIRDIYLKYREKNIAETGSHSMTIFAAKQEMLDKTGLSEPALAQQLTKLSMELILKNPGSYLRDVREGWINFWRIKLDIGNHLSRPAVGPVVYAIWRVERWVLMLGNLLAMGCIAYVFVRDVQRRWRGEFGLSTPMILACTIVCASILQAMAEYGENPRYAVPTQSLAMLLVILTAWDLRKRGLKALLPEAVQMSRIA